ncbi:MAG: hypothetical protein U0670_07575 [Anaerolineae bacterium]
MLIFGAAIPAFAQTTTFSGTLSAGTPLTGGRPSDDAVSCSTLSGNTFYYDVQQFQVPASGTWTYADSTYGGATGDLWVSFYTGTFDPSNPLGNGCFANFDDEGSINLTAGVTYTVMISTNTPTNVGPYTFILTNQTNTAALSVGPTLSPGRPSYHGIGGCSPTSGGTFYYQTVQFTPSVSGLYTYADRGYGEGLGVDMELSIYSGTFDPSNTTAGGCIANFDDIGAVNLDAGVTYTLLINSHASGATGTAYYVFAGPDQLGACPTQLPAGAVVRSIPNGAAAYWGPDLSQSADFTLPAGTWWTYGTSGDFTHVWIACYANPIWVPTSAVAP